MPYADSTGRRNTSIEEGCDGKAEGRGVGADGAAGDAVAGPAAGRRGVSTRRFWVAIASGLSSEEAAAAAGVSGRGRQSAGSGRVAACRRSRLDPRRRGGTCRSPSARRSRCCAPQGSGCGRSPGGSAGRRRRSRGSCAATPPRAAARSTIGRRSRSGRPSWRARRPKTAKLAANDAAARVRAGPARRHGRRADGTPVRARRCGVERAASRRAVRTGGGRRAWSPEQISNRLRLDFPDDESMRISHEAIYQALYVQGRGALQARAGRLPAHRAGAARAPGAHPRSAARSFVTAEVMISERPAEAADRAVPGHWEGDLIIGLDQLRDRHARRAHHPVHDAAAPAAAWTATATAPSVKNGPALAGHGAEAVRDAIAAADRDAARAAAPVADLGPGRRDGPARPAAIDTGLAVYFCDPHSPWQRGTNENTNGLLRQYFPKGTDLARHSADDLAAVAAALNSRPRKTLGWQTPPRPSTSTSPRRLTRRHTQQTSARRPTGQPAGGARVAIAAPARPPGEPARRQPHAHPPRPSARPQLRFVH